MIIQILLLLIFLFLAFSAFVGYKMVTPPREVKGWTPKDAGMDYMDVEIETGDGIKLRGWWIDKGSNKTVIPLHGYTSSRWGFYIVPVIEALAREGYNVLAFDFRAHGESEGKHTTIGDKEFMDVLSAIDWIKMHHPERAEKIGLIGYSMGAILTIRGLAEEERVNAGIADSPPIYIDKTGARGLRYFANLPEWIYTFVKPFTKLFSKGREINPIEYADRIKKPLLLIAGERDPLVKVDEVQEFYEKNRMINPNIELWITEGAHVRTIAIKPEEYKKKVLEFFGRYL